jgi:Rrf2 family protein
MRISAKGEYAAKAVLFLSFKHPEVVTIQEIAQQHSIPVKYLEHILLSLKKSGLLQSRRGVKGGYQLAKPPDQISLGEVLSAVDGKFAQAGCSEEAPAGEYTCPEIESCGLKAVWRDVQNAVEGILFRTTFDDIKKRTLAGVVRKSDYMIYEI